LFSLHWFKKFLTLLGAIRAASGLRQSVLQAYNRRLHHPEAREVSLSEWWHFGAAIEGRV